ncbi:homeobox domain-containing protein, partial [Umbelopsis sp. AD052]
LKKTLSTTKAKRKRITPDQFSQLMALFEHNDTPSYEIRDKLAGKIGMSNREIQVWFQNRRAKANRAKTNEKLRSAATKPQDYGVQFMPTQRYSYHWPPTPGIDLLASAAEYVQREEERLRKNNNR